MDSDDVSYGVIDDVNDDVRDDIRDDVRDDVRNDVSDDVNNDVDNDDVGFLFWEVLDMCFVNRFDVVCSWLGR